MFGADPTSHWRDLLQRWEAAAPQNACPCHTLRQPWLKQIASAGVSRDDGRAWHVG